MGWGTKATTRPLYSPPRGEENLYPLCRRLGWPQDGYRSVRKISLPTRIRSPNREARSEALYWQSYPGPLYPTLYIHFMHSVHEANKNRQAGWCKSRFTLDVYHSSVVITAPVNSYVQTGLHYFSCGWLLRCSWTSRFLHRDAKNIVKPCLLGSYLHNALTRAIKLFGSAELILITRL